MFAALSNVQGDIPGHSRKKGKKGKGQNDEPIRFKHADFPTESQQEIGEARFEGGVWMVDVVGGSGHTRAVEIGWLGLSQDRAGKPLRFQEREVSALSSCRRLMDTLCWWLWRYFESYHPRAEV